MTAAALSPAPLASAKPAARRRKPKRPQVVAPRLDHQPRVLGLDLALGKTGVAGTTGICGVTFADTITTPSGPHKNESALDYTHRRIQHILDTLADRYLNTAWDLAVMEGAAFNGLDPGHQLAGLRWIVAHRLHRAGIPYTVVSTSSLKLYATGSGSAGKPQVVAAVQQWLPTFVGDDNAADALVLAAIGSDWFGHPIAAVADRNRKTLSTIRWPDLAGA